MFVFARARGLRRPAAAVSSLLVALAPLAASGDVSFVEPRLLPAGFSACGALFIGSVAEDFDGDGKLDVAVTGRSIVPLLSATEWREFVAVWLGNGDGTFQAPVHVDLGPMDAVGDAGGVAADLDGAGHLDLAVAAFIPRQVLGDMSLVGPRPLPVRDVERMDVGWHKRRFAVQPGITCLWQVRSREPDFDEWIQSDMEYIDRWSLGWT